MSEQGDDRVWGFLRDLDIGNYLLSAYVVKCFVDQGSEGRGKQNVDDFGTHFCCWKSIISICAVIFCNMGGTLMDRLSTPPSTSNSLLYSTS